MILRLSAKMGDSSNTLLYLLDTVFLKRQLSHQGELKQSYIPESAIVS